MSFQCCPTSIRVFPTSQYVVNNSFHCGLQHKRVSIDSSLFSLVHKKIFRKALIERKFQETLKNENFGRFSCSKGFKGKTLSNFSVSSFKKGTPKGREQHWQYSRRDTTPYLKSTQEEEQRKVWHLPQSNTTRPNMMCNLSLYRKGWKRSEGKKKVISISLLETNGKIKTQPISEMDSPKVRIKTHI